MQGQSRTILLALLILATAALSTGPAMAGEWTRWRGPAQDGVSPETGLIDHWSPDGANLLWRQPLTARSTPVVFDGRACTNGRVGEGNERQEFVACFDAGTGARLWEHRFKVYLTTIPWNRVGWASLVADPETGNLYALGVAGNLLALDRDGNVVWSRDLAGEVGFYSGYGGRTPTPTVDEDRLYLAASSAGWGEWARLLNRVFTFDKRTGELLWVASPGGAPDDPNTQITPVVAVLDGRRLVINGNGDGNIYALDARTGAKVWEYHLSKRGLNSDVVVGPDGTVYAAHSEENQDTGTMGRVVAFSGKGAGDLTPTNEKWRTDLQVGFSSPALDQGRLYVITNAATLVALDAATGTQLWEYDLGTVGKASPVVADGKLYATEVNGRFHILGLTPEGPKKLDEDEIHMPGSGRHAEIYGSPAVAYGRIYFTTEEGIYCLGDPEKPFVADAAPPPWPTQEPAPAGAAPAQLLVVPAERWIKPGEQADFRSLAFTANGLPLGEHGAEWSLQGLKGTVSADGVFTADPAAGTQQGKVQAKVGELTASARVKVVADPPLNEDFEGLEVGGRPPAYFSGGLAFFKGAEFEGGKVLTQGPTGSGINKHRTFFGAPTWANYTLQVDLLGTGTRRKMPDMGLVASGYTIDLRGVYQRLEVRFWDSEEREPDQVPFAWETGEWYTMKVRVDNGAEKTVVRVKVWPRSEAEPGEWLITVEDPIPIPQGSAGLYGYTPVPVYYDNLSVIPNP